MKRALAIVLLSVTPLFHDPASGCGWGYGYEEYRFWLLRPQLAEVVGLGQFHYAQSVLYGGEDVQEINETAYRMNLAEWRELLGDDVPEEAIRAVLYGTTPRHFWEHEEELFRENAFLRRLERMKEGWPAFIRFAKRCEGLVDSDDPWGFKDHDSPGIRKAWDQGMALLAPARHPMLRARIAYQLVRLAHYATEEDRAAMDARAVYEAHLAPLRGRTWLEPSAAFYMASMLEPPDRDLAYAEIFDRALDKRFRMLRLYVSGEAENYLPLAKDDKHRAAILVMRCLQDPGRTIGDLERIAEWDPGNTYLPMLLAREVSKLEDWLLTPITGLDTYHRDNYDISEEEVLGVDLAYLRQVQAFIGGLAARAEAGQRALLRLFDGHLAFIAGDLDACGGTMAGVIADPAAPAEVRTQARLTRLLCGIMSSGRLTAEAQGDLLAVVDLLGPSDELGSLNEVLLSQLHLYLGRKLMDRGEVAEGILLLARTDRAYDLGPATPWGASSPRSVAFLHAGPEDYDRMIALLEKPDKTPFERYLTGVEGSRRFDMSRNQLLDYKATCYMDADQLEEALAVFRQIPDDYWDGPPFTMFATDDPFKVDLWDPHNYGHKDRGRYNKRTIVERMVALKREAERKPRKRALNHYLLGNAYFNMTWHGKYWIMSRIGWSTMETYGWGRGGETPSDDHYYGCSRALAHYEEALRHAKDPLLKAMACRMAVQCKGFWEDYSGERGDADGNPYADLLTDPKSWDLYREIEECMHYDRYAGYVARFK